MKNLEIFRKCIGLVFWVSMSFTSCADYLDVAPPEQPGLKDANKEYNKSLGFLYTCYAGVSLPIGYDLVESASDEFALPPLWSDHKHHRMTYNLNLPSNISDGWSWGQHYRFVGQCHLFTQELHNATQVSEQEKREWLGEIDFLLGYYHMMTLLRYGPCPITDKYIPQETPPSEYNGRSHFDYVTNWIVGKFDSAAAVLPATRIDEKWGRATSVMAKALKARLLLHAASPLWNGSFPFPEWKNKNFETPGYGKELVSLTYDASKWERAREACQEALHAASAAGHALYTDEELYSREGINLPYVPGVDASTTDGKAFLKKVMLMRYLVATRTTEGNREIIWGSAYQGNIQDGSLPHYILTKSDGTVFGRWSGVAPILSTSIEYFYTKDGKRPVHDNSFISKEDWFKSAGISGRTDIINLNLNREPRFYAWFAFDGGDYGSKINNGNPLRIELRNADKQGYNPDKFNRDNNVTGYFSQKFIVPRLNYNLTGSDGGSNQSKPRPIIRMAELYLNLAECEAALNNTSAALNNLNIIRQRAGVPNLTTADLASQSLMDWVRNERFIELWGEGHRYYDIRRWMIAQQTMSQGVRTGLNAYGIKNPTFEQFNTVKPIEQPYVWVNRMYLLPVFHIEVYKNPQLVQAPGY